MTHEELPDAGTPRARIRDYADLRERLRALPGATEDWLRQTVAFPAGRTALPVSYCLIRDRREGFRVFRGDGRGGSSPTQDDAGVPLSFPSESAACQWIWDEIAWWREFEARRHAADG